jgi:hypothetical protein
MITNHINNDRSEFDDIREGNHHCIAEKSFKITETRNEMYDAPDSQHLNPRTHSLAAYCSVVTVYYTRTVGERNHAPTGGGRCACLGIQRIKRFDTGRLRVKTNARPDQKKPKIRVK